ncbi:MAG: hypothetical protein MJ078_04410, partial [Clostridia bacterium]|nr:hypothetical protein [Clostridia bacterium]
MKPFVSIRLLDRFHNDPSLTDKLLVLLNRHIKKDADVWLTTSLGFPALEEHKKQALRMKTAAEKIRRNGYTVTLQVANTIGHGDLGKNFSFAMFQKNMQDIDGNEIPYVSCPGNEAFLDYTEKVLSLYAEAVRPDIVYPDDDLRMVGDKQGCFCPDCLARFNGMFGVSYTRETLKKALYEDEDFALSLKWRDFCDASLARVTEAIVRGALKGVSCVKIGLQMCTHMHYERYERVCRTITELTGEKPLLRAGGGVYHDRTPFDFVQKGLDEQFQSAYVSRFIETVRPELAGYPHTAFNK